MPRVKSSSTAPMRLGELFGSFSLMGRVTSDLADEVLAESGKTSIRSSVLPARAALYVVLLMSLWSELAIEDVLNRLLSAWDFGGSNARKLVSKQTISAARKRLGSGPLARLYRLLCSDASLKRRVFAFDGSCLSLADSASNAREFGRPGASRGASSFPQLRFAALADIDSGLLIGARMAPYSTSEHTLMAQILSELPPDSLVILDQGLFSFASLSLILERKAHALYRVKQNIVLPVLRRLPDGSYLSHVYPTPNLRRKGLGAVKVRVVEFTLGSSTERYRLLTSNADFKAMPARELAALYARRWSIELAFRDLKTKLKGSWGVLRSKTPEGVRQEFWALLIVHNEVRRALVQAARSAGKEPKEMSFIKAVRVIQDVLPSAISGST